MASLHERYHGLTGTRFENPSRLRRRQGGFWSMPEAVHHRGQHPVRKSGDQVTVARLVVVSAERHASQSPFNKHRS